MTSGLTFPDSRPLGGSNRPPLPAVDASTQDLNDRKNSTISVIFALLKDTNWPPESSDTAQNLLQTINDLHDIPTDIAEPTNQDSIAEFVNVLEDVHARLKKASEKYGKRERGLGDEFIYSLTSLRRGKCTDILRTCRDDIEKASAALRNCFNNTSASGHNSARHLEGSETPSELLPKPTIQLLEVDLPEPPEPLGLPQNLSTRPAGQTTDPELPTSETLSPPLLSLGLAEDRENRSPIRDGALIAARKTFKTVEAVSGAIPGVGDFVGVAAKVGLAFVNMIETMDKNEDVSKELASQTSKLSSCLEHFKKTLDAENSKGDEVADSIKDLHKELECVQQKVIRWNSSGRFKRAFLAHDHAEELKGHQDTVQNALEEMQLLVSLKITDILIELKNTELQAERTRLLDRLGDGSYGARGNSIEDVICLPGTRVELLDRINEWIRDTSASSDRVLWIRGMAGRGKSTIASTVAHRWVSKGSCAIFHFRRGQNTLDSSFICALARQLGKGLVLEVKKSILECVKENEDIAKERLEEQFRILFVGSLRKLHKHSYPIVIIVDALDECNNTEDAVRLVRLIDQHSSFLPPTVKFLLTCRPDAQLLVALEPRKWHAEDLDSMPQVSEDIARFIQHACIQIREDYGLPKTWPPSTDLKNLVNMSQGLFQWARTAITYIGKRSPAHRLRELLQRSSTWSGLDDLYHQILLGAFEEVEKDPMRRQMLSWVLETLVVAPYPVTLEVIACLHANHEIFSGEENITQFLRDDVLADLNSLLHIPSSPSEPVRLMHTSIRDLLTTQERCKNHRYYIDPIQGHQRLAKVSLRIMERDLKRNICDLARVPLANSEIWSAVERHVSQGLRYCCRSWSTHLTAGMESPEAMSDTSFAAGFKRISNEKLLSWLEVMSLIGAMAEASTIAKQVHFWIVQWPQDVSADCLKTLWNETQQFINDFFHSISSNAFDIYAFALPQWPVETKLWLKNQSQATAWILVEGRKSRVYQSTISTVAFSPDGRFIVSGSSNGAVQLWNSRTGAMLGDPMAPHGKSITSVAFSPDSGIAASGSGDAMVQLWDAQTGAPLGDPLIGHSKPITRVAFSPDGNVLASASGDATVQLWDARTGKPLGGPLTGHSGWVKSMMFSPSGIILASGSDDNTIRLWDVQTRAQLGEPLTGHSDWITAVAFSPNSIVLASGSDDNTIRLWDGRTGAPLDHPLIGHSGCVNAIVFSPDSKLLASGSDDSTVRLWDAQARAPLCKPLTGHRKSIWSVVFSSDGMVLASGSDDWTVQLWDVETRAPLGGPLTGHRDLIISIAFLPDSNVLASVSPDREVRFWDPRTGQMCHRLSSHLTS